MKTSIPPSKTLADVTTSVSSLAVPTSPVISSPVAPVGSPAPGAVSRPTLGPEEARTGSPPVAPTVAPTEGAPAGETAQPQEFPEAVSPVPSEDAVKLASAMVALRGLLDGAAWTTLVNRVIGGSGLPRWDHHDWGTLQAVYGRTHELCRDPAFVEPFAKYYLELVRAGTTEALAKFLILHAVGVAFHEVLTQMFAPPQEDSDAR